MRTNFDLGDYETACFAAMKTVEVAVRDASGLENSLVGVALMRRAFQPHQNGKPGGPLADAPGHGPYNALPPKGPGWPPSPRRRPHSSGWTVRRDCYTSEALNHCGSIPTLRQRS